MVTAEPMTTADRELLSDRLAAEIRKLIVGRSLVDAIALLECVNSALARRALAEDEIDQHTVH
jgi:hypothetical protein